MTPRFDIGKPRGLSPKALSMWAKSLYGPEAREDDKRYLQLWQHLEDAGEVALRVWDNFLPSNVKKLLIEDVGSEEDAKGLYLFLASIHDDGKATPAFVVQNDRLADQVRMSGIRVDSGVKADQETRRKYRHELATYETVLQWFKKQGFPTGTQSLAYSIASITANHHGSSITRGKDEALRRKHDREKFFGDEEWENVRFEFMEWAADSIQVRGTLKRLAAKPLRRRTQILLTAAVVIADWIASNTYLFPLNDFERDETTFNAFKRAERAWKKLDLPKPWNPREVTQTADEQFAQRFNIPGARLRPVQREAVNVAWAMKEPGLIVIEANMGEGKTEAALIAAEILASRFHCGGIYYALPTQATVNGMFTRVLEWIDRLPSENQLPFASLFLAHGKRELNPEFQRLREKWFRGEENIEDHISGETSFIDSGDADEDSYQALQATVNSWLLGAKRGNLSDFVVGTIDQVLMAGLKSKYVVLRHFALAGKVVILDEIHSNTAYMNVYMEDVLSWLGAYGVPVIMLSATLPQERREAFLKAYKNGATSAKIESAALVQSHTQAMSPKTSALHAFATSAGKTVAAQREATQSVATTRSDSDSRKTPASESLDLRYPLISSVSAATEPAAITAESSGRSTDIAVTMVDDDDATLIALLKDKMRDGGCAVVIRNTVSRAQHTYDVLRQNLDIDVSLAHSRFLAFDRARIDRDLIRRYGKYSTPQTRTGIVVATQVVEQSLDVDFDFMVTDIAPIDLVLQRSGRLHRHHRGAGESLRPQPLRSAQLYITGIEAWNPQGVPQIESGSEKIYFRYLLLRSLAVLGIEPGKKVALKIPDDISRLVQIAYSEEEIGPRQWEEDFAESCAELTQARNNSENDARRFGIFEPQWPRQPYDLRGWLDDNLPDPDDAGAKPKNRKARAQVRESDDSFEVLVLQQDAEGNIAFPRWGDFTDVPPLPTGAGVPDDQQARAILSCSISLSETSLQYSGIDTCIYAFEEGAPDTWRVWESGNKKLHGQLLILLDEVGEAQYVIPPSSEEKEKGGLLHIKYSPIRGWEVQR
ncbi:MAG: CRISPR-associated helicase Cas3' [Bifidobacteriaceae bacterium]|jgi:CRISPR-associated endonuclease/helicase Cas3|nr:CRISPR-associated helicase Cas3' [Bifidobacteriaceae bacterium]MCI1979632.1 CRISPR-associated helicase Cas3' [Bifidobacteriaceae bacterium]